MFKFLKGLLVHKWLVMWYMAGFCRKLLWRALTHDLSKLSRKEMPSFIALASSEALRRVSYKSDEYKAILERHRPIIEVHYKRNSHHPDYYCDGILEMDLFDIIEMICDWRAAGRRTKGGNLAESFKVNRGRYNIPPVLYQLLRRTFLTDSELMIYDPPITVREMIREGLELNGYGGLYSEDCGCELAELIPCCGDWSIECRPGYKVEAPDDDTNGYDFYIMPTRKGI
jgi:hypothetical protein